MAKVDSPVAPPKQSPKTRVLVKGKLVKLRARTLPAGGESLYLDYSEKGKRKYDFLGVHLIDNPKTSKDRQLNKDSQLLAERMRSEREVYLSKNSLIVKASTQRKTNIISYIDEFIKTYSKKDKRIIVAMFGKFKAFLGDPPVFLLSDVTPRLCGHYRDYLEKECKGETPYNYFKKFRKILKQAVKEGLTPVNPAEEVENRKTEGIKKDVLSTDEIQKMANADCFNPEVKRAFLFSCVTGLRFCDVNTLEWKSISDTVMRLKQQKTGKDVVINLNKTAMKLLGVRPTPPKKAKKGARAESAETKGEDSRVFNLPSSNTCSKHLQTWADKAKVEKKVTWHCARHSFGTNLLISGADVRSVSGLLGHSSLVETQKYVRLVDSLKEKAVENLPEILF